ncbi:hypothetical protein CR513_41324, partial [Mucuna pruriens]
MNALAGRKMPTMQNLMKRYSLWHMQKSKSQQGKRCGFLIRDAAITYVETRNKCRESVKLVDNSKMTIMEKGNVKWKINGITQVISKVFYIPKLNNNLLSLIISNQMSANRMFVIVTSIIYPPYLQNLGTKENGQRIVKVEGYHEAIPKKCSLRASQILELNHANICELVKPKSKATKGT